jgi:hypothetical protein
LRFEFDDPLMKTPPVDPGTMEPRPRTWWLVERGATVLSAFRIVVGAALLVYFLSHWAQAPQLLRSVGLLDGRLPGGSLRDGWAENGRSESWLRALLGLGAVLSVGLTIGVASRACAAGVYAILLCAHRTMWPIADLDDYMACLTALVLTLAPKSGVPASRSHQPERAPVAGVALSAFLALVLFLYMTGASRSVFGPQGTGGYFLLVALPMIPVLYALPGAGFLTCGLCLQLGVHVFLLASTGAIVGNALLAATALLFWGGIPRAMPLRPALDAGGAIALVLGICGLSRVVLVFFAVSEPPGTHVLDDLALLPPAWPPPSGEVTLRVQMGARGKIEELETGVDSRRGRTVGLLLARLQDERDGPLLRSQLGLGLARLECQNERYWGEHGRVLVTHNAERQSIFEFRCDYELKNPLISER